MRALSGLNLFFVVMRFLNYWYFVICARSCLCLCDLSKLGYDHLITLSYYVFGVLISKKANPAIKTIKGI